MRKLSCASKKPSTVHGFGLFADRKIEANTLIVDWLSQPGTRVISRKEYEAQGPKQTAIHLIGDLFIDGELDDTDFINHSDTPNVGYLLGMLVAAKDIEPGEELFVNYRSLLPEGERNVVEGWPDLEKILVLKTWMKCDLIW